MVSPVQAFVDKLTTDTLNETLRWYCINELDKSIFSTNKGLETILSPYAHHYIFEDQSFFTNIPSLATVYVLYRRAMSGKDGTISTDYELYIQEHELAPCHPIEASQESLAKLATIIKNETPIKEEHSATFKLIKDYLEKPHD